MSIELAKEVWVELKQYISVVDIDEAAETMVSLCIDNDIDPDDIRLTFKGDRDIKKALQGYLADHVDDEEDEDYEYDDE